MIVYWLSQDSNITPPVCIAAFAGATIAKTNMWRTAFSASKFAKFLYLAPFLFGYVPGFSLWEFDMELAVLDPPVRRPIIIPFGDGRQRGGPQLSRRAYYKQQPLGAQGDFRNLPPSGT